MAEFVASEAVATAMGAGILSFLLVFALKIGPLRFLGEMLAQFAFQALFLALAVFVLFLFATTGIGEKLGGIETGLIIVLTTPFVLLVVSLVRAWLKRSSASGSKEAESDD